MYLAALFHHQGFLQVRFELTIGGPLGEGTRVSKGCGFSTMCAFSHVRKTSFLAIIPNSTCPFTKAGHFIIENSLAQEFDMTQNCNGIHLTPRMRITAGKSIKSGNINNGHTLDLAPQFQPCSIRKYHPKWKAGSFRYSKT